VGLGILFALLSIASAVEYRKHDWHAAGCLLIVLGVLAFWALTVGAICTAVGV
jgi:hypothetical protein